MSSSLLVCSIVCGLHACIALTDCLLSDLAGLQAPEVYRAEQYDEKVRSSMYDSAMAQ